MKKASGYYRRKKGTGVTYQNERGHTIVSVAIKNWIASLAIPPAWEDVWISKDTESYLLATGYDQKKRKQYIYHPAWEEVREAKKLRRLRRLATALPKIRKKVGQDLKGTKLTKDRVLAAMVSIIDTTGARIGNESYAQANDSYGISTLRKKHVSGSKHKVFAYEGKAGVEQVLRIDDAEVIMVVQACEETPGLELFKFIDDSGAKHDVSSDDVNEYIKAAAGAALTAKDFRTWHGSVVALTRCCELGGCSKACLPKHMKTIFAYVAKELGNTPQVAAESYVHAAVMDAHDSDALSDFAHDATTWRSKEEQMLLLLLNAYEEEVSLRTT